MTTDNHQNQSTSSFNHVNSSPRMQGWIRLIETIRQSDPSSNESLRLLPNNRLSRQQHSSLHLRHTNDHLLETSDTDDRSNLLDSPLNIFNTPSIISLTSSPTQIIDDLPFIDIEPVSQLSFERELEMESTRTTASSSSSSVSTDSQQSAKHPKKIIIRRSNRSKEPPTATKPLDMSTPITEDISDDDVLLVDIRKPKTQSIDTLSMPPHNDSMIPLATDILSLPGHIEEDLRNTRFLTYTDTDSLAEHMHTCLIIDRKFFPLDQSDISKTHDNVLNKIFRFYYIKTIGRNLVVEKKSFINKKDSPKQQPLSVISSPTSSSFKIDWKVNNKRHSSAHRSTPKNVFHILQSNPQTSFTFTTNSSSISTCDSPTQTLERVKDILARTYYPHLYAAVEYGYQFGRKSIFPNTQQLITKHNDIPLIKQRPESPCSCDDSTTITLKSPPWTDRRNSVPPQQSPGESERNENDEKKSSSSISIERRVSENFEDISPLVIRESVVILTPTPIPISSPPLIEKGKKLINNRKRKSSPVTNTNVVERKRKRIVSSPSPEMIIQYEDISNPESEEEVLPTELPKQSFIKNGLRSNYYKTSKDNTPKSISKTRAERRRRQSSGSLPSFYTGIFQSDEEKSPHIDYCLPYDIYWHGQQNTVNNTSSAAMISHKKKKSTQPKQKQPLPFKKLTRNVYTDQIKQTLLSSYSIENAPVCDCKPPDTCEDGVCVNKMIFTECLPSCVCGTKCNNQKIRKAQWFKHLEVFDTSKYGQGLRTTSTVTKGTFLCEYVGEIITDEKFHERMTNLYSKDEHHYTMRLTQNFVIDAYRMGSIARFANHSCSPNCEFQKWTVDGLQHMCMFSRRPIKAGEELTYDYNFECFNLQSQQPCYCESSKCRGTIGAKQQSTTSPSQPVTTNNHQQSANIQRLTQREKRMVLHSSIFLLRNLRRIKEKRDLRKKNGNNKLKQRTDKQSALSLFFPHNYYHSNGSNHKSTLASLRKTPKLAHKEIFYLFYNHIRRSHFAKSGRYQSELIDPTCYYAQLAQLTLIFNDIFDLILHYRCLHEDVTPSIILQKCPSKRLVPAYYEIISKPIDLTMIRNKLDNGEYGSFALFEQDLALLFKNAVTFCGEDSDEARVVFELEDYFLHTIKIQYQEKFDLFLGMNDEDRYLTNLHTLEEFIARLHEKEVSEGQIREVLYDLIYCIDENSDNNSPIIYKIVLGNTNTSHRTQRPRISADCIVHCRCGSVYDENSLVQCYACQLWQHVACVSIVEPSRPYYCFECQPVCEQNPSACLKTNVLINATLSPLQTYDDNHSSYSTLTRADGFLIRVNECYFVPKQEQNNIDRSLTSPEYDILCVERLWIDDYGVQQASGFYYIRPNETFHEPTRKFFPNEVFRFPTSNDPLPISSFVRPCFVFDMKTYTKGKPISDNSSRVLTSDIFICEYRVDKSARTFTRLVKSRQLGVNTKSYCFDNYVDKPVIKRDYQPYQKEIQLHHYDNRRRPPGSSNRLTLKQLKEKNIRINGCIEKLYCRFHDQSLMPNDTKFPIDLLLPSSSRPSIFIEEKPSPLSFPSPARKISKKRPTISLSSDDDIVEYVPELDNQRLSKKRATKQKRLSPRKRDEFNDQSNH